MPTRHLPFLFFIAVALQLSAEAQPRPGFSYRESVTEPRVPADPLEAITAEAVPVQNAEERLAAINLLGHARSLSNLRDQPYDLKTTFTSSGSSSYDGVWNLEDISPSAGIYRWTAQGPSYSVINLFTGHLLYSNQPTGGIPLRLAQVRGAIFFNYPVIGARASIRTATATLNGATLNCVLTAQMAIAKPVAGGRNWEESEYCVDAQSGLLAVWSPSPGVYVLYDYSAPLNYHSKVIPGKISITEAGRTVVEATLQSVSDPAGADRSLFDPATLYQTGVGSLMSQPVHVRCTLPPARPGANLSAQVVVVHGMLNPAGEFTEAEVVASSNPSLNQSALNQAAKWKHWRAEDAQPGATPLSHEVFFTVQFLSSGS